jgi:hypothetical protein
VLLRAVVVTHPTVDRLELLLMRQVAPIQIHVARNAIEIGVDRGGVVLGVDVERDFLPVDLSRQVGILVAHQTVVVLLCPGDRGDGDRDDQRNCGGKEPSTDPINHDCDLHPFG